VNQPAKRKTAAKNTVPPGKNVPRDEETPPKKATPKQKPGSFGTVPSPKARATASKDVPAQPDKPAAKPEPKGPKVLRAKGISKEYGDLVALAPLDLYVKPGEAVVLIGHNGSGKTTFLRMAAGLLDATDGSIEVGGAEVGSVKARASLSYLSDSPTFYEDLSVWEHLEFTAGLHGVDDWEQHAADLLDHLGIYDRADDLPSRFSRGLKQKASIAMALIRPMSVLLVDEPFVGLDAAGKKALLELFDSLHSDGVALVVATHELEFVNRVDRCVALRDGLLIHDGPVDGVDVLALVS
jgi:ABC-2 type transport system ATP-binding protein